MKRRLQQKLLTLQQSHQCFKISRHSHCENSVISPNFLVWKFCGKAHFPHSFGLFARNYEETVFFHKISTPGSQVKLRKFLQCNFMSDINFPCSAEVQLEAVAQRCSVKKVSVTFHKIQLCRGLLIKLQASRLQFYLKKTLTQIFSGEFYRSFKNIKIDYSRLLDTEYRDYITWKSRLEIYVFCNEGKGWG